MMDNEADIRIKEQALTERIKAAGKLAVAFSGGVDSTYLVYKAHTRRCSGQRQALNRDRRQANRARYWKTPAHSCPQDKDCSSGSLLSGPISNRDRYTGLHRLLAADTAFSPRPVWRQPTSTEAPCCHAATSLQNDPPNCHSDFEISYHPDIYD